MFRVAADSLETYLDFDPMRKPELLKLDALIRKGAPKLERHFHQGTPAGEAGMRMKMIGYGKFRYTIKSGQWVDWPVIGVALQKNYISVYLSLTRDGAPLLDAYVGTLGEARSGRNNFSFVAFDALDIGQLAGLIAEAARIFAADPANPEWARSGAP
jgi:hypothetical protein